jgi:isopentenyl diphosphate isomerase/L-lactate dehydrogenase-like FMN-dependent dehydrogenase
MAYLWSEMELHATWEDAAWFCEQTELPVVAKGVMSAPEARSALDAGCAAVLVSNQGGRQLDGDPATIDVLPAVVEEVGGEVDVMVDGGIRNGAHVLKALALGAKAVLIGRPIYWSLAVAGAEGLEHMLSLFRDDLINVMQMAGVRDVKSVPRELVTRPPEPFGPPVPGLPSGA